MIEWYNHWNGKVYVSFSGGKDSTVLLTIARQLFPDIEAVFVDTGLEYPELRQFVKTIDNVTWIRPEMNFRKVIEKYGYPLISKEVSEKIHNARNGGYAKDDFILGTKREQRNGGAYSMVKWNYLKESHIPVSNQCCAIMKKKPAKKYEKQSGKRPILATMTEESRLRKSSWLKHGCNAFNSDRPISAPMSFWTEQDVLEYIDKYNIPIASVYGDIITNDKDELVTTGCQRTGCVFCGYGCHLEKEPNRFQKLKKTHPTLWDYCMRPWDKGGLGMKEVLDFIGVKIE